ncbi:RNA recognition motif-containing protein [Toxoplasma gondii FOU]|uniref:RNA recognition motif-containing protein n=1 Tax=Toxoplasma gondii FOU TaxID=943167 RepID=A0A086KGH8_TOXGO|nr:RNA recognition motif-containing protein [Toxoplasma gondii FOU]
MDSGARASMAPSGSPGSENDAEEKRGDPVAPFVCEETPYIGGDSESIPQNDVGTDVQTVAASGFTLGVTSCVHRAPDTVSEPLQPPSGSLESSRFPSSETCLSPAGRVTGVAGASHRLAAETGASPRAGCRREPAGLEPDSLRLGADACTGVQRDGLRGSSPETLEEVLCKKRMETAAARDAAFFEPPASPKPAGERPGWGARGDREKGGDTVETGRNGSGDAKKETTGLNTVERTALSLNVMKTNVFVFQIPLSWAEDDLHQQFSEWGTITSVRVERKSDGRNRGYGFVCFSDAESAQRAVEGMDGRVFEGKQLKVSLKKPRQQEPSARDDDRGQASHAVSPGRGGVSQKARNDEVREENDMESLPGTTRPDCERGRKGAGVGPTRGVKCSLFVFHVPPLWGDEQLLQHFELYGRCASAVVVRRRDGTSKGYGFVDFEDAESALCALQQANQAHVDGKRLKVLLKTEPKKRPYVHAGSCASAERAPYPRKSMEPASGVSSLQSRERSSLACTSSQERSRKGGVHEEGDRRGSVDAREAVFGPHGTASPRSKPGSGDEEAKNQDEELRVASAQARSQAASPELERERRYGCGALHRPRSSLPRGRGETEGDRRSERFHSAGGRGIGALRGTEGVRGPRRGDAVSQMESCPHSRHVSDGGTNCERALDGVHAIRSTGPEAFQLDRAADFSSGPANGPEARGINRAAKAHPSNSRRDKLANARYGRPECTVFVFHVPPEWSDGDLRRHFRHLGRIRAATIQRDKDDGQSRGFGFITFGSPAAALNAVAGMNGFHTGSKYLKVMLKHTDRGDGKAEGGAEGREHEDREKREKRENRREEGQPGRGTGPSGVNPRDKDRGEKGEWHASGRFGGSSAFRGMHPTRDRPEGRRGPRGVYSAPLSGKALDSSEHPASLLPVSALVAPGGTCPGDRAEVGGIQAPSQRPTQRSVGDRRRVPEERVMPLPSQLPSAFSGPAYGTPASLGNAQSPSQTTPGCGDRTLGLLCGGPQAFPFLPPAGDARVARSGKGLGLHNHARHASRASGGAGVSGIHPQPLRTQVWLSSAPPPPPHQKPMNADKTVFLTQAQSDCFACPSLATEATLPTPYGQPSLSSLCSMHRPPMPHDCGSQAVPVGYHEGVNDEGSMRLSGLAMGAPGGQHASARAAFLHSPFPSSSSPAFVHASDGDPRGHQGSASPIPGGPDTRGDEVTGRRSVGSQSPPY